MKLPNIARKALALACAAAIAALSVLGLVGCGPSAEELIKQALTADLDAVKNVDEDTVKAALGDETLSEMESYGIDPYEFYTNCVKNFSYDNLSVKVEGDSATVTLDATNVDIEQVMSTWQQDCYTYMLSQEAMDDYTSMGESGMMKKPSVPPTHRPRRRTCRLTSRRATTGGMSPTSRSLRI